MSFMRGIKPRPAKPIELTNEQQLRIWQLSRGGSIKGQSPHCADESSDSGGPDWIDERGIANALAKPADSPPT